MPIDPITGLDLSTIPLIFNQIPLASDPVLAPEWDPQGRYTSVLHPDNIPTVFATLQAHNDKQPLTAQSLHTDGNGNLRVTSSAGSVSVARSFADTAHFDEATLYTFDLGIVPAAIIGCTFSIMFANYNGPDLPEHVSFDLVGTTSGAVLNLARIAICYDANPLGQVPFVVSREWAGGMGVSDLFAGDSDTQIQVLPNTVAFGTLAWTLQVA